jgi:hypothetical protein
MGLTMRERHAIVRELTPRLCKASRKERTRILSEFVKLTGYNRCYGAFVLRTCGREQVRVISTQRVRFIPRARAAEGSATTSQDDLWQYGLPEHSEASLGPL